MARKKEYDRDEVLHAATLLFWTKGYQGTSMSDLVNATGLNKHSMYAEFSNKEGLYLQCLDMYANKMQNRIFEILTAKPLGLKNVENFLHNRVEYALSTNCKGCLLVNSTVEKELLQREAFELTQEYLSGVEKLITKCFESAQINHDISRDANPKILAKYVLNFNAGLMVIGKAELQRETLEGMLEIVLNTFKK
jgi:TetR/AcrR family transcriptional repressor of nem operon